MNQQSSRPKAGHRVNLPPCPASADALAIAGLARQDNVLTIVTGSPLEAQRLAEEISWFAPNLRVNLLPDWETLPYDSFSPHQDLISERLATLHAVTQSACDVLITAAGLCERSAAVFVERPCLLQHAQRARQPQRQVGTIGDEREEAEHRQ